jgi:S-adenosylmethionine synthetase
MKILVTGGSGLLGRELCKRLRETQHEFVATAFSRAKGTLVKCDLEDPQQVSRLYESGPTFLEDKCFVQTSSRMKCLSP